MNICCCSRCKKLELELRFERDDIVLLLSVYREKASFVRACEIVITVRNRTGNQTQQIARIIETGTPATIKKGGRGKPKTKLVSRSTKAGLQFPVSRIARFLKEGRYTVLDPVHQCTSLLFLNTFALRFWNLLVTL
ncbi:hypothetical protein RYX36_031624 [Vicia faba]